MNLAANAFAERVSNNLTAKRFRATEEGLSYSDDVLPPDQPAPFTGGNLLDYVTTLPVLSANDERKIALAAKNGDPAARNQMIVCNLRLVVAMARRYDRRGLPMDDLVAEGILGLMRAVEKFDPGKGFRFSTYAGWWIYQSIERAIMFQTRLIRIPSSALQKISAERRRDQNPGTTRSDEPPPLPGDLLVRLDQETPQEDNETTTRISLVDDETKTPDAISHENRVKMLLRQLLGKLPYRQRIVIEKRFELDGTPKRTLREIGAELGLSHAQVRNLENDAINRLHRLIVEAGLDHDDFF